MRLSKAKVLNHNPFHEPAWRWHAVVELVVSPVSNRIEQDRWIQSAIGHFSGQAVFPAIDEALALYLADTKERWKLESYLLAGLAYDEIAKRLDLSPDVVRGYEGLFFDVIARLGATDWIARIAIKWSPICGLTRPSLGTIWRHTGYVGGAAVLAAVIDATESTPFDEWLRVPPKACMTPEQRIRTGARLFAAGLRASTATEFAKVVRAAHRLRKTLPDYDRSSCPAQEMRLMASFWKMLAGGTAGCIAKPNSLDTGKAKLPAASVIGHSRPTGSAHVEEFVSRQCKTAQGGCQTPLRTFSAA